MIFLSFMNLFRNYRRTIAILLTIALGTAVLFSFKGFINGILSQYRESTIHALYGHGQINEKDYRKTSHAKPWEHWISNWNDIRSYLLTQNTVEYIFPRINFPSLLKHQNVTINGSGQGIDAKSEANFFYDLDIESGTPLVDQPNGILLGIGLARALNVNIGDEVTIMVHSTDGHINDSKLIVTGIFNTGSVDFDNHIFRIQLKIAQQLLNTSSVELIALGLRDYTDWDAFALSFEKQFPMLETTSFAVLDQIYYQHSVDWLNAQFHVIQLIILSIVLLGIFNTISSAILERKQEIGNFRANGESISDIMRLITLEGFFLGLLGSCLGISLTYLILKLFMENQILLPPGPGMTRPFYITFQFEWHMAYTSLALSTAAAMVASLLAGIRVARMPISEALRQG